MLRNFYHNYRMLLLTIIVSLIFTFPANAQKISVTDHETGFTILQSDANGLQFQNQLSAISAMDVQSRAGMFTRLSVQGYNHSTEAGAPMLPVLKKLIELPHGADVEILLTDIETKTIKLSGFEIRHKLMPAQPPVSKSDDPDDLPFVMSDGVYQTNDWYGQELVRVVDLGMMRGVRIARLEIAPVLYNPVSGELRITTDFDCEIRFAGGLPGATASEKSRVFSPWFEGVFTQLINHQKPGSIDGDGLIDAAPATYIIVSDPMFETALQPFIQWKTKKGFNVVEAYTDDPEVGSTTTSIKNYLTDFYQNPPQGYHPQSFVLIVGDVAQVPAFNGDAGNHVTDLYYCEYTSDFFPECFYGRFSANNLSQLQPQLDKTLEYEQYAFPDPSFLDEVVMVAGHDNYHQLTWGNGQINYGTQYYFNAAHGLYSHTYLQPEPSGGNYSQNIRQNVSDGVAYANYSAHCSPSGWADPGFTTSHISGLTNSHRYPLMVGNCCSSVEFQTTCFGEEILRAPLKGAIGYIGGSNSTYWDEDFWWGVGLEAISANPTYNPDHLGAYDRTFHDQAGLTTDDWFITQGQMPSAGNLAVTQSGSSREEYYWEIYHLMGDPSLMIYFSQPPQAGADYPDLMPLAAESFTVNTDPYAYVAISKDGILHGAALAGSSGKAVVNLDPITVPGEADVVITGQNLQPYMGTVMVSSPSGPYLSLENFMVDDADGNGNGMADYGETFYLDVDIKNLGNDAGNNIELTLSSASEFVSLPQPLNAISIINPSATITLDNAFEISIAQNIPDGELLNFVLEMTDGSENWQSNFSFAGHAPVLEFAAFSVSDPNGNGNGKLDPGETVNLMIEITNAGSSAAFEVFGELTSTSPYISIETTDPQAYGDLGPDDNNTAVFEISCNESTPAGQSIDFGIELSAQMDITGQASFSMIAGQIPVLVVDLDENNSSAGAIVDAMDALGVASEYTTSFPSNLELYSSLFVCLGIYSSNHVLSSAEGQALADYLNAGGNLYMEGGDTWYYDSQTPVHSMFGINATSDGSGDLGTVLGIDGTITEGMSFSYTGENNWIDRLSATGSGELILENQSPDYGCAVVNEASGYKTIGLSFEYAGLSGNRSALIEQFLIFFDLIQTLEADFTASITEISAGEEVQFTNLSNGNPVSFSWHFEGGTPTQSIDPDPVIAYNQPGTYDVSLTVSDGNGTSALTKQDLITVLPAMTTQTILVGQGWSGISSCLVPENPNFNQILGLNLQNVVLIQTMTGVYYPDFQVNTLGDWDYQSGYMIKADAPFNLELTGAEPANRQITLEPGWNLMPVLSPCNVTVNQVFGLYLNKVQVIKSIAGTGVYWPDFNINTLGMIQPGKAYFVNVSEQITITFPACE